MVRRLANRGYVNYQRYRGFTLTDAGRAVAVAVKARHHTLSQFLEQLGLEPQTIDQEVEEIEHHLTPQTLRALRSLVEHWKLDPKALAAFQKFHRKHARG